jgi:histidinol-phosphate aminotransferase
VTLDFDEDYQIQEGLNYAGIKVLFLANPNSPSGTCVSLDAIRRVCRACPGLVVVDEAYVDFSRVNALPLLKEFPNLVITRTFSKSYSLAGLRAGLAFASPEVIRELVKVKDSYNLDRLAQAGAAAALDDQETLRKNTARILATRERFTAAIKARGIFVYPSEANFVFARIPAGGISAREIYLALKQRRILVRYFDAPRLRDCLRISMGRDDEMETLLAALGELRPPSPGR